MKTVETVQTEKSNVENTPGKSSLPKRNDNNTGVKNGIGIQNAAGNKNSSGKTENKNRHFSNERPIF